MELYGATFNREKVRIFLTCIHYLYRYEIEMVRLVIKKGTLMYLPSHFEEVDEDDVSNLIEQFPLATIVC